ncbi:hypothetical protein T7987_02175 [Sulfitobacter faviae]|uniref:GcrA cell cycle regulator n=1 Tax=Sulfitobacter faviae TaxID=1775881 RepID=A0ABZ0V252_9RHOB|nr:hypothetical protein [Sulfitobacter faviae]WPZ22078.1 hypothetical protein T7987_02175 [Sulfitobacter faviae]
MADYDRSTGAPWSAEDLEQLRILAAEGTATGVIAVQLNRSEEAIAHRAAQDGIALAAASHNPYDPDTLNR